MGSSQFRIDFGKANLGELLGYGLDGLHIFKGDADYQIVVVAGKKAQSIQVGLFSGIDRFLKPDVVFFLGFQESLVS